MLVSLVPNKLPDVIKSITPESRLRQIDRGSLTSLLKHREEDCLPSGRSVGREVVRLATAGGGRGH